MTARDAREPHGREGSTRTPRATRGADPSATTSRRILIVEDEPNVRMVFSTALVSDEYTISVAEDGETALRWLASRPYDLVLLDLRMPGIDGIEVLSRLRTSGNDVPVVIVSAYDSIPNVVQTIRLGAFDFLPK